MTNAQHKKLPSSVFLSSIKLLPLALVAACGMLSPNPSASRSNGYMVQEMAPDLQEALCQGRAQQVMDVLLAEPLVSPTDQFYTALALEEAGAGPRARMLYAGVVQTGSQYIVRARCADRVLANGPVADEAGRRLAALSELLTAMDVNLSPVPDLHEGIPASGPTRVVDGRKFPASFAASGPPRTVYRPASQSPLGQWFVHLSSYRSIDNAMQNKSTLENRYPALTGIIDQWELDVGGNVAVRLGVRVSEKSDADRLCTAVKSQQDYCAVIDTSR